MSGAGSTRRINSQAYNATELDADVDELRGDPYVKDRKNIYEYVLGGKNNTQLLSIRLFDEPTKGAAYKQQTDAAKAGRRLELPALCA